MKENKIRHHFKKLRKWTPADHYGHLGISFKKEFAQRNDIRRVYYYQYPNLEKDPMVVKLNQATSEQNKEKMEALRKEVVHFRKPARLWAEINGLFAALNTGYPLFPGLSTSCTTYPTWMKANSWVKISQIRTLSTKRIEKFVCLRP
ncbi:MAG: hypothetical protein ACLFPB_05950 [Desulfovermiculus sp.]